MISTDAELLAGIREIENLWIPLRDGCRLAARVWMPDDVDVNPVPAVIEYIPYRKRDFMRSRDEPIHRYFAAHGYVAIRVDVRGSGDSEGVLEDEYSAQELEDAIDMIEWVAAQPWCAGSVGMMGISWGGFNALQVAALQPPALKAIITLCSTDDRYADDAHYMGGCLLNENMQWGSILMLYQALPPDPNIVGERWRDMWHERMNTLKSFPVRWMSHQSRDDFWKHGSVCEDYTAITCPVYAIGGWADGYSNSIPRLLEHLECPKKGLIGPWAHNFPHDALPGPCIGFLQEALRWWDHWLKDQPNDIMQEPALRIWMQEWTAPQPQYAEWPGRWVAEAAWPSANVKPMCWYLNPGVLEESAEPQRVLSFSSPQTTGMCSGEWCAFGADGEMPRDQRTDDGGSLVFDSVPLSDPIELLGAPLIEADIKIDRPVGLVAVRLGDVAPDGSVQRVSYGLLNLTHHVDHENPQPLQADTWYRVSIKLNDIAYVYRGGHRIRLSFSTSYWPIAWPSPAAVTLSIKTGSSCLSLPSRAANDLDGNLPSFGEPESAPSSEHRKLQHLPMRRTLEIDLTTNEHVHTLRSDGGELGGASLARIEEIGLDLGYTLLKRYRILDNDPLSAQTELVQSAMLRRDQWSVRVQLNTRLSATAEMFQFSGDLQAFEDDVLVAHREWAQSLPRNCV